MILDTIFDTKIGIGRAQYIPLFFLSLIDLNDGAQLILSTPGNNNRLIPDSDRPILMASVSKPGINSGIDILSGGVLRVNNQWQIV